jgi:peptidoglycan hydrolase-like amidase
LSGGLIESQTIVARSWMLANVEMKHRNLGMDVCNDDCCQRYQGTTFLSEQSIRGALGTAGQV